MNAPEGRTPATWEGVQELRTQLWEMALENLPTPQWVQQLMTIASRMYFRWITAAVILGLVGLWTEQRWILLFAAVASLAPTLLLEFTRRLADAAGKTPEKIVNMMAVPHTWITIGIYCVTFVLPDTTYTKLAALGIVTGIMIFMTLMGRWHRPTWWYQGITMLVVAVPPIIWTGQILGHTFFPKPYTKVQIQGAKHLTGGEVMVVAKGTVCFADKKGRPNFNHEVRDTTDMTVYVTDLTHKEGLETYFQVYQGGRNPKLRGVRVLWVGAADLKDPAAQATTRAQRAAMGLPTTSLQIGQPLLLKEGYFYWEDDTVQPDLDKKWRNVNNYWTTVDNVVTVAGKNYARLKLENVRDGNGNLARVMYVWVRIL